MPMVAHLQPLMINNVKAIYTLINLDMVIACGQDCGPRRLSGGHVYNVSSM